MVTMMPTSSRHGASWTKSMMVAQIMAKKNYDMMRINFCFPRLITDAAVPIVDMCVLLTIGTDENVVE
jgi:hypothetical protein